MQPEIEHQLTDAIAIIDRVLRRYLRDGSLDDADADDVRSTVLLRLVSRDDESRAAEAFVAAVTHNAVRDLFRERRPDRARLRKQLQTILRDDERFVVNREAADTWCSLRTLQFEPRVERFAASANDIASASSMHGADALGCILQRAGGPVRFDELLEISAGLFGTPLDYATVDADSVSLFDRAPDLAMRLIERESLARLWNEIRRLPERQRAALLLHLRDDRGGSAIPLLIFTGVATLDDIARAIGIRRSELEELWERLPLPDLEIASLLDTVRSNVIGLRKAARERLTRFMRGKA